MLVLGGNSSMCRAGIFPSVPPCERCGPPGPHAAWRFGATAAALGARSSSVTIALAFIDQETGLLPDTLTLPLVWLGLLLNLIIAVRPLATR